MNRITRFIDETSIWIKHAVDVGTKVIIFGITGQHWVHSQWETMILTHKMYESKHRLCGLGIKVDVTSTKPSNVCIRLLTSFLVESTKCSCKLEFKDHGSDWSIRFDHDHRPHDAVLVEFCCSLLERGSFCFVSLQEREPFQRSAPDSNYNDIDKQNTNQTDNKLMDVTEKLAELSVSDSKRNRTNAYPTDERVEWKKRRKENKEKGKEVKRKVKIVEDHFDDCGTDLSGLAKVADEVDDYYVEFDDDSEEKNRR